MKLHQWASFFSFAARHTISTCVERSRVGSNVKVAKYELVYKIDEIVGGADDSAISDIKRFVDSVVVKKASVYLVSELFLIASTKIVSKFKSSNLSVYVETFNNRGDKTPLYMELVAVGGLLQGMDKSLLPPAMTPAPLLTEDEVTKPLCLHFLKFPHQALFLDQEHHHCEMHRLRTMESDLRRGRQWSRMGTEVATVDGDEDARKETEGGKEAEVQRDALDECLIILDVERLISRTPQPLPPLQQVCSPSCLLKCDATKAHSISAI
ncbi:hypothetical protein LR48_Vigan01g076400 [Vigna angularis]|uniref:glycerophosphodiester phosphodiesterase n=1 Tax=Phaseolus angularis TaxID=3914 RepID=A0A0L9TM17_PHAAN|nr:hypothetical protein LR48_Vigan01g076400 [Vigna angularis]